jgi:phosphoketolase
MKTGLTVASERAAIEKLGINTIGTLCMDAVQAANSGHPGSPIHRLTYRRTNHKNLHVRGYNGEGTTTTPFDMVVLNDLDRFHLAGDVIDRLPQLGARTGYFKQAINEKLIEHKEYIARHGDDMPAISGWRWARVVTAPA